MLRGEERREGEERLQDSCALPVCVRGGPGDPRFQDNGGASHSALTLTLSLALALALDLDLALALIFNLTLTLTLTLAKHSFMTSASFMTVD